MEPTRETDLLHRLEKREQALAALTSQNEKLRAEVLRLETENKFLRAKVDKLVHRLFGKSSEQISPAQLELLLQFAEDDPAGKEPASPCGSPGADTWEAPPAAHRAPPAAAARRPRLPEHLPVVEEILEPDEIKADPAAWKRIGEEVSEQLDYEPARFFKRRTVRPKYVRRGDGETPPVIAPLPPSLQDAGLAAPGLLAAIITASRAERDSQPAGCPEGVRAVRRRAANTATTSRSTVRNTSIRRATALISPVKPCPAG